MTICLLVIGFFSAWVGASGPAYQEWRERRRREHEEREERELAPVRVVYLPTTALRQRD